MSLLVFSHMRNSTCFSRPTWFHFLFLSFLLSSILLAFAFTLCWHTLFSLCDPMIDSISSLCHCSFNTNQCDVHKFKRSNLLNCSTLTLKELEEPRPTSDVSIDSSSLSSVSTNYRQLACHPTVHNFNRPAFRTRTFCSLPSLTVHLVLLFSVSFLFCLSSIVGAQQTKEFTNEFAVELDSNSICSNQDLHVCKTRLDQFADRMAVKHGFVNQGQVNTFSFKSPFNQKQIQFQFLFFHRSFLSLSLFV